MRQARAAASSTTREAQALRFRAEHRDGHSRSDHPGSGALTPLADSLITQAYSRNEKYAADRHGVESSTRAGFLVDTMMNTLNGSR
jgi:hypothetical protein